MISCEAVWAAWDSNGLQIWTRITRIQKIFIWKSQSQCISITGVPGATGALHVFFSQHISTFWKTDWIHHKSIGHCRRSERIALFSTKDEPAVVSNFFHTSTEPWHPVASGGTHKSYKSCRTLLNASVRTPGLSVPTIASYHESVKHSETMARYNAQRCSKDHFLQRFLPNFCSTKLLCRPNQWPLRFLPALHVSDQQGSHAHASPIGVLYDSSQPGVPRYHILRCGKHDGCSMM